MGKQELIQKIDLLKTTICQKEMHIKMLESKIELGNRKTNLDATTHHDILTIMQNHHKTIAGSYPEGSTFSAHFLDEPTERCNSKHFRWHPAMIKWCIFLRHKSSKAYELIRKSKSIILFTITANA